MEIVEALGREQRVEQMILCIARTSILSPDLQDLAQMVYLALLDYPEDKLADLWEHGQINFFLARIILNQYRSRTSRFYFQVRKFRTITEELASLEFKTEG